MNKNIINAISIISTINATISLRNIIGVPEFKYPEPLKEKSIFEEFYSEESFTFCNMRNWWVNKFNVGYHIVK